MSGQRVIVTGGATNIGRAITESFLREGGRVVVGQPDTSVANDLIAHYGDRVMALPVDVGDPVQCRRFIDAAAEALGGVDVLVNNAAITGGGALSTLEELTSEHYERIVRVNLGGSLFCAQAVVPHLRASGGGVVINLSSINAWRPQRGAMIYAATKAAINSVTQSMAKELAADGIRVVAVAPGDISVDTSSQLQAKLAARGEQSDVANLTPLGRGAPGDIAETVVFLCSARAKFVTGTTWLVDGGLLS